MAVERSLRESELTDMSSSRIRVALECMRKFDFQYRQRLPAAGDKAASIFGTVIHQSLEAWYGGNGPITPENAKAHQEQKLSKIVEDAWPEALPPKIWQLVEKVRVADRECDAVCSLVLAKRPELKAPRQTKEFQESQAWKDYGEVLMELLETCNAFDEIGWPKDENAYQALQRSVAMAKRIESEWAGLPRPMLVEEPFRLEFKGYVLRGAVDQVRRDPNRQGELGPAEIFDVKTGRNLMTQMQAFWQAFIYNEAVYQMREMYDFLPDDIDRFGFYMTRHIDQSNRIKVQRGRIDRKRHGELALRILDAVTNRIQIGSDEPNYGFLCKNCDFRDLCERDINLWKGDGLT